MIQFSTQMQIVKSLLNQRGQPLLSINIFPKLLKNLLLMLLLHVVTSYPTLVLLYNCRRSKKGHAFFQVENLISERNYLFRIETYLQLILYHQYYASILMNLFIMDVFHLASKQLELFLSISQVVKRMSKFLGLYLLYLSLIKFLSV